jgi:hypothetical protein
MPDHDPGRQVRFRLGHWLSAPQSIYVAPPSALSARGPLPPGFAEQPPPSRRFAPIHLPRASAVEDFPLASALARRGQTRGGGGLPRGQPTGCHPGRAQRDPGPISRIVPLARWIPDNGFAVSGMTQAKTPCPSILRQAQDECRSARRWRAAPFGPTGHFPQCCALGADARRWRTSPLQQRVGRRLRRWRTSPWPAH